MTEIKVTIRNVDKGIWGEIRTIHQHTGVPYGRLVTQALKSWVAQLPEGEALQVSKPAMEGK